MVMQNKAKKSNNKIKHSVLSLINCLKDAFQIAMYEGVPTKKFFRPHECPHGIRQYPSGTQGRNPALCRIPHFSGTGALDRGFYD
jgi:hypothetical protein